MMDNSKEYLLCAAIWYKKIHNQVDFLNQPKNIEQGIVICGRRHHNCMYTIYALYGKYKREARDDAIEGFLTSQDRFVDRYDAVDIALASGQIQEEKKMLFSEDLY